MPAEVVQHPKKIIRGLIVARLKGVRPNYATPVGKRVHDSRDINLDDEDGMPQTIVYTSGERILEDQMHAGGVRKRDMTVSIETYDNGEDGAEMVDRAAWANEEILRADRRLGGVVESVELVESASGVLSLGEVGLHFCAQTYRVIYWTHQREDDAIPNWPPREVLLGFDPDTGPGNEEDYVTVGKLP